MSQGYATAKVSNSNSLNSNISPNARRRLSVSKPNPNIRDDDDDTGDHLEGGSSSSIPGNMRTMNVDSGNHHHHHHHTLQSYSLDEDDIIKDIKESCCWGFYTIKIQIYDFWRFFTDCSSPGNFVSVIATVTIFICMIYIIKGAIIRTFPDTRNGRTPSLHLYMVDIAKSGMYDILLPLNDETPPPLTQGDEGPSRGVDPKFCSDRYLRCEFYWANNTNSASDLSRTSYCSQFVCKGVNVKLQIIPDTCSGLNRLGFGNLYRDLYEPLPFTCVAGKCGSCSTVIYNQPINGPLAFLQGCEENHSCFGQIVITLTDNIPPEKDDPRAIHYKSLPSLAPPAQFAEGSQWPKAGGGLHNNGLSPFKAPSSFKVKWKALFEKGSKSSPTIGADGSVYVGSEDGKLYAYQPSGSLKWQFETSGPISTAPVVGVNNIIYITSSDKTLYAVQAGELLWKYKCEGPGGMAVSSPTVTAEEVIVFTAGTQLIAVAKSGNLKFLVGLDSLARRGLSASVKRGLSAPAISSIDGTIYIAMTTGELFAFSNDGKLKWTYQVDRSEYPRMSSPVISKDGKTVYIASDDKCLYAITNNGLLKWRYFAERPIVSSPAIDNNDMIVFGTDNADTTPVEQRTKTPTLLPTQQPTVSNSTDAVIVEEAVSTKKGVSSNDYGYLIALSEWGTLRWRIKLPAGTVSSPIIDSDNTIIISNNDKNLYAISSEGKVLWKYTTEGHFATGSSSALSKDGTIYLTTWKVTGGTTSGLFAINANSDTNTNQPPTPAPSALPVDYKSWVCTAKGDIMKQVCATQTGDTNDKTKCLPGLNEYIGKGVDITFDKTEVNFVKRRVFEFSDLEGLRMVYGTDYASPNPKELTVSIYEKTSSLSDLSGAFNNINNYTENYSRHLNLTAVLHRNYMDTVPQSYATASVMKAAGIQSSLAYKININLEDETNTFVNVATFTRAEYRMVRKNGQMCASAAYDRLARLPDVYDRAMYRQFIDDYGTHVIIGATMGGSVTATTALENCAIPSHHGTISQTGLSYAKRVGDFTTFSVDQSIEFFDQKVIRRYMHVCGGKESVYGSPNSQEPWRDWTKTILREKNKVCLLTVDLIPVWVLAPPATQVRKLLELAVFDYLESVNHNSHYSRTKTPAPCKGEKKEYSD